MKAVDTIPENAKELIEKNGFKVNISKDDPYSKKRFLEVSAGYNLLQYQCVIRPLFQKKYNISLRLLELLLFIYPMQYISQQDYKLTIKAISWNIKIMLEYGWLKVVAEGPNRGEHLYGLTLKSKRIVEDYYKYMSGEKQLPEFVEIMYNSTTNDERKRSVLLQKFIDEGPREKTNLFSR